ncbi:MAG: hypothetical protein NT062_31720 [Proteobacteria bacterium]|nr:hypothetical protein [Pseudomonadota bacterium]
MKAIRGGLVGLALLALASATTSCIVKRVSGPRLTGTCDGACDHYVQCKPGHPTVAGQRCRAECPTVFADAESLMMFESLSCRDAVEYVDGTGTAVR